MERQFLPDTKDVGVSLTKYYEIIDYYNYIYL
jgi:hypothetical protein